MIINKDYDMSLWLILIGNKQNRALISEFIKEVPEELYESLREVLKNAEGCNNKAKGFTAFDSVKFQYSKSFIVDEYMIYSYYIDVNAGCLKLERKYLMDQDSVDTLSVLLYPIKKEQMAKLKNSEEVCIGAFHEHYNDEDYSIDYYSIIFKLTKNTLGRYTLKHRDYVYDDDWKYSSVNVNGEISGLTTNDLANGRSLKRVMRRNRKSFR